MALYSMNQILNAKRKLCANLNPGLQLKLDLWVNGNGDGCRQRNEVQAHRRAHSKDSHVYHLMMLTLAITDAIDPTPNAMTCCFRDSQTCVVRLVDVVVASFMARALPCVA